MVGEIRDGETAQIAVQASLTGHLVLSTLHTNTAIGAITRLQDMGIEPFLLSSSLLAVMAQRLVRLLCKHCREPYTADAAACELLRVDAAQPPQLFHPKGCLHCNNSGYRGRTGIYEFVEIDDTLRSLIHERASEQSMAAYARTRSAGIGDDGRRRILAGETTVEEVLRVTSA
jgi:general secretion pathway protein E